MDPKFNNAALKIMEAVKLLGSLKEPAFQSDLDATAHTLKSCASSLLALDEAEKVKRIAAGKPKA